MKVIGTDNYNRDYVADILVAKNVTKEEGERIVDERNARGGSYWHILVEDNYRLSRGMADCV